MRRVLRKKELLPVLGLDNGKKSLRQKMSKLLFSTKVLHSKTFDLSNKLSILEFLLLGLAFFAVLMYFLTRGDQTVVVYASEAVSNVVLQEHGMRASLDFLLLNQLLLIFYIYIHKHQSVAYSQGKVGR